MDSADFTNLLKIISPLSISVKKNIENFIDKNNNKNNKVENFYNTIEATIPQSPSSNSTKTDSSKNNNSVVTKESTKESKESTKESEKESTRDKIFRILYDIFNVLLGLWAAYISWKVNTIGHWSIVIKIIFAITAFFLAPLYLLLHFIFRYEYISNLNSPETPVISNTEETPNKSLFSFMKNKNTSVSQQPSSDIPSIPVKPPAIIPSINTKPPNSYISNINNTNNTNNTNSVNSNINKSKYI